MSIIQKYTDSEELNSIPGWNLVLQLTKKTAQPSVLDYADVFRNQESLSELSIPARPSSRGSLPGRPQPDGSRFNCPQPLPSALSQPSAHC